MLILDQTHLLILQLSFNLKQNLLECKYHLFDSNYLPLVIKLDN